MKRCPVCNRVYTDPSLNFCLADGAFLADANDRDVRKTVPSPHASEMPTESILSEQIPNSVLNPTLPSLPQREHPAYVATQPAAATGTRRLIPRVVAGILLAGVAVLAFVLMSKEAEKPDVRVSADGRPSPSANFAMPTATTSPTPTATLTPTPTPTPTATPTPTPNTQAARAEIQSLMNSWADSLRRRDLSSHLRLYADRMDTFYQLYGVGREQVRASRAAIFAKYYSSVNVQLSNISVEVDPSGTRATVSYDNSYNWKGGAKYLTGKSQNSMIMSKVGGQWLITSERHLKTYYEDSGN